MDVSNSTGENTGYRVMGGGQTPVNTKDIYTESGSLRLAKVLEQGQLSPNEYVTLELKEDASWVEFDLAGKAKPFHVKLQQGNSRHLLVALVPNGEGTPKAIVCHRKA